MLYITWLRNSVYNHGNEHSTSSYIRWEKTNLKHRYIKFFKIHKKDQSICMLR